MAEPKARVQSPSTGPIVGGILAALILIFGSVIIFRLVRRRWVQKRPKHDTEQPLDGEKKTVVDKISSLENASMERWSLAHTITDSPVERRHSNHPNPPPDSKQEESQRLVPPLTTTYSSTATLTLQPAKPTARLSPTSDTETQSIPAITFVTAMQSPRNVANAP
jgi:hypothetical protein